MTDNELRNFVIAFRRGLLGRRASTQACFMLCAPLSTLLTIHGVPNTLVEVWLKRPPRNHVWLKLSDGRALDPSADQFNAGLPPVYLGPPLAGVHEL
jgi:hypothetical protein